MPSTHLHPLDASVRDIGVRLRAGEFSATELATELQQRIDARNGGTPTWDGAPDAVNAWAHRDPEATAHQAAAADARIAAGDGSPLCGIPIGVKALFGVAGQPQTASSRVLEGNIAEEDSAAWAALAGAGAVYAGHTHTHEFAAGGTTDQVGNPWNLAHSAGGSSGGSAAAVAAGMVPVALGTDTAGSVRIPAALSGVSAFKPTFGTVSNDGVIPLSMTLDHVGPIANTLADCAAVMPVLRTATALQDPWGVCERGLPGASDAPLAGAELRGARIAITGRAERPEVDTDVRGGYELVCDLLRAAGAVLVELPAPEDLPAAEYDTILLSDARSYHAQFLERIDRYRPAIREFANPAAEPLPVTAYLHAQAQRRAVTEAWHRWFAEHRIDALLEPTSAVTAPLRGPGYDAGKPAGGTDPLTCFTATWNVTGFPVASLPAGIGATTGLPVGVSLIGPPRSDSALLDLGIALQALIPPPVWSPLAPADGTVPTRGTQGNDV